MSPTSCIASSVVNRAIFLGNCVLCISSCTEIFGDLADHACAHAHGHIVGYVYSGYNPPTRRGNIATRTQRLMDFGSPRSCVTSAMSLQENYQSGSQNIVVQGGRRVVVTPLGATTSTVTPRPQVRT